MKIGVFYENIVTAAQGSGLSVYTALERLKREGMKLIYPRRESFLADEALLTNWLPALGIGVEGIHGFCSFSEDPDREDYKQMFALAQRLHAGHVLIVPGKYASGNSLRDVQHMIEGMRRVAVCSQETGIPVVMENLGELMAPHNTIAGVHAFLEQVPGLLFALDTGNGLLFGDSELEIAKTFADRTRVVHVKDCGREPRHPGDQARLCADGTRLYPCPAGTGVIRLKETLDCLAAHGYEGDLIIEQFDCDPAFMLEDLEQSVRWLREYREECHV